jgi:vacuolar-type H+-ATPase catalytic subunit A/Vma1
MFDSKKAISGLNGENDVKKTKNVKELIQRLLPPKKRNQRISEMIATKYSIDDQIAVIANKDSQPEEYEEFQRWRTHCKETVDKQMSNTGNE